MAAPTKQPRGATEARPRVVSLAAVRSAKAKAKNEERIYEMTTLLRYLTQQAVAGEITGLMFVVARADGTTDRLTSVSFREDSCQALKAAMGLAWCFTQKMEETEG